MLRAICPNPSHAPLQYEKAAASKVKEKKRKGKANLIP